MSEEKSRRIYDKKALVRCTEAELAGLHQRAKKAKLSLSRYLVKSGLSDGKTLTAEEREELKRLRFDLRKIGVNLNQIAFASNAAHRGTGEPPNQAEFDQLQADLKKILDNLLKKL